MLAYWCLCPIGHHEGSLLGVRTYSRGFGFSKWHLRTNKGFCRKRENWLTKPVESFLPFQPKRLEALEHATRAPLEHTS